MERNNRPGLVIIAFLAAVALFVLHSKVEGAVPGTVNAGATIQTFMDHASVEVRERVITRANEPGTAAVVTCDVAAMTPEEIAEEEYWDLRYETLQIEQMGYRCRYDFEKDVVYFEMYKGLDRTQSQVVNNFVVFSKGFKNLRDVSAEEDDSNYKNYFVIGGTGEGDDRIYTTLDLSGGGYRRELFIDAKSKSYNESKQTMADYKEVLIQTAREKAEKYVKIENIEFDADTNTGAKYLTDYDLGDKCDVVVEPLGLSYEARITEILESWKDGEHTVTLTFGDKIPTQYEKARIH